MRPSLVAWSLLPLFVAAIPLTSTISNALPVRSLHILNVDDGATSAQTQSSVRSSLEVSVQPDEARVVLPCRGCSESGADEYLVCPRTPPRLVSLLIMLPTAIDIQNSASGI